MKSSALLLLTAFWLLAGPVQAQSKFMTKTGRISFFSASAVENIEAVNQQVAAVLDVAAGQLAFSVPIRGFVFKKTLMQEHFNENYLESEKYPKATFSGQLTGVTPAALAAPGPHPAQATGDLTLHGVTRHIVVPATLELRDGQLLATAGFAVALADYNIDVPLLARPMIAENIDVKVALTAAPVPAK